MQEYRGPLHAACELGMLDVVKVLVERGGDVEEPDKSVTGNVLLSKLQYLKIIGSDTINVCMYWRVRRSCRVFDI